MDEVSEVTEDYGSEYGPGNKDAIRSSLYEDSYTRGKEFPNYFI